MTRQVQNRLRALGVVAWVVATIIALTLAEPEACKVEHPPRACYD